MWPILTLVAIFLVFYLFKKVFWNAPEVTDKNENSPDVGSSYYGGDINH